MILSLSYVGVSQVSSDGVCQSCWNVMTIDVDCLDEPISLIELQIYLLSEVIVKNDLKDRLLQ